AGPLLRYRRAIEADDIGVFCDIKKKHASHALTADVSVADAVQAASFFGADAVVITGTHTGQAASASDVRDAATASALPVLVGSGVTAASLAAYDGAAAAVIVGSDIKRDGIWSNPIDPRRAEAVVSSRDSLTRG
ncbi:MAG: BtpA/SgcQ family protein, partial [Planctomycetota bacterium]